MNFVIGKRGEIVTDNTSSGVVALLIIIIIAIPIGILIYQGLFSDEELEAAQGAINSVQGKVEALQVGQSTSVNLKEIETDESWYLVGWSKDETRAPDVGECTFSSCICICKTQDAGLWGSRVALSQVGEVTKETIALACENKQQSFCREVDSDMLIVETRRSVSENLENFVFEDELIQRENSDFSTSPFIQLKNILIEVKLQKTENKVEIYQDLGRFTYQDDVYVSY